MRLMRRLRIFWSAHPGFDLIVGIAVTVAYFLGRRSNIVPPIVKASPGQLTAIYQTTVGAGVSFLAFGMTPVAIILGLSPGPRLTVLLRTRSSDIAPVFVAALWRILALVCCGACGLLFDVPGAPGRWPRYLTLALAIASVSAIARMIDTFSTLLRLIAVDREDGRRHLNPVTSSRAR